MKPVKTFLILFIFAACFQIQHPVVAQKLVSTSVFGNGGAVLSDSSYCIVGTLGQPIIGVVQNPSNTNGVGFWYLASHKLVTDVEQNKTSVPKEFRLEQNYPNPFNPTTTIEFALPQGSAVTLKLYDILGREVATLADKELGAGVHTVVFDAHHLASGVYFYRMRAEVTTGDGRLFSRARKLMLLK